MNLKHNDEFPILCETCLGPNPFIRMTKEKHGKSCKICERPFTVYRWKPGPRGRYKKTELCHTCAKLKNVCQTCVLDLQFGVPVQVRDSSLADYEKMAMPTSATNRGYLLEAEERKLMAGGGGYEYGKAAKSNPMLERLARRTPYYRRNLAHLCSFFAAGTCNRGKSCPYRHEMPTTGPLANQNIKDRYYGHNDPVAEKMLNRKESESSLATPEDKSITTLWLGGLEDDMTPDDVAEAFQDFGEPTVRVISAKHCAFVSFSQRKQAEDAAKKLFNNCKVKGVNLRVRWGRRQTGKAARVHAPPGMNRGAAAAGAPPPPPGMPVAAQPLYPSQHANALAAKLPM
mmetsp:Transcript_7412/g.8377  ORF Transcript_7412/g.8377 Transcript_7412/m.8377 type:complete len:343 (+) Transcript_7412:106-1134(+)